MAKECSEYTFEAGSFCTFTSSNIKAIEPGDRIVYAQAAGPGSLDTDVVIAAGPGNFAAGHCTLVFASLPGRCTFSGGTGKFTHFRASVAVSVDATGLWHWERDLQLSAAGLTSAEGWQPTARTLTKGAKTVIIQVVNFNLNGLSDADYRSVM